MDIMIYMKIHRATGDTILAACDEEVLGNTYRGEDTKITVSETFYNGRLVTEEEFIDHMEDVTIMNLVGERAVSIAIEKGHVSEDCILDIGGVKHAQVVKI